MTTSTVNTGVATKARFSSVSVLTRVHSAGAGVISTAAQMVKTPLSSKSQFGKIQPPLVSEDRPRGGRKEAADITLKIILISDSSLSLILNQSLMLFRH